MNKKMQRSILRIFIAASLIGSIVAISISCSGVNIESLETDNAKYNDAIQDSGNNIVEQHMNVDDFIKQEVRTYKVGLSMNKLDDDDYWMSYLQEIERYCESLETDEVKYDIILRDAKYDVSWQYEHVDDFIKQEVDVILVNLVCCGQEIIAEKAKAADIPVVFTRKHPYESAMEVWDKSCFIGFEDHNSGTCQGEIIRDLPDHGDANGDGVISYVMLVGDPESADSHYRTEFSIKALTDAGIRVEELVNASGGWEQAKGKELTADALAQFGDMVDVIFANNDEMAMGAIQAVQDAGRTVGKDIYIVGIGAIPEAIEAVRAGDMTGTIKYDIIGIARASVNAALLYLAGENVDTYIWIDWLKIT